MANFLNIESEFLDQTIALIEAHMEDESFGVAELSEKAGMSRSNLLRRVQKLTGFSVSVLIRQVRLNEAKGLLTNDTLQVSEVAYQVGFNSVSYFIRCYRELYGYPPGEELERSAKQKAPVAEEQEDPVRPAFLKFLLPAAAVLVLALLALWLLQKPKAISDDLEKSIAVLPFKNNSADSSNVYIINGLMESILSNLQKIEALQVISRTSVEPYRQTQKTIPEISEELGVNYFIEGSGQKVGDQILLSITLVQASNDVNLWSEQYNRQVIDIFELQADVAKDIAREIKVLISPEVEERIEKKPTENLAAYDLYLRGLEISNQQTFEGLERALIFFDEASIEDPGFAHPYALTAICYYYLDLFKAQKQYQAQILDYANRALELDAELPQSLIAKGLYYMHSEDYDSAARQFERALIYNPNSAQASNYLSDIYSLYEPNTEKYLRYALRGAQLETVNYDSGSATITYLHLANALIQNGFVEEAESSILRSLEFDPDNIFSRYVHAYILLAKDNDVERSRNMIAEALALDTTRLDVVQELGKMSYFMEDYEAAYQYYHRFATAKKALGLNIFPNEDILVGYAYEQQGFDSLANIYYEAFREFAENDDSIYRSLLLASYDALKGNTEAAIANLKVFAEQKHIQFWFVRFLETDPIIKKVSDHPDYQAISDKISDNFWAEHEAMKESLREAGLLKNTTTRRK